MLSIEIKTISRPSPLAIPIRSPIGLSSTLGLMAGEIAWGFTEICCSTQSLVDTFESSSLIRSHSDYCSTNRTRCCCLLQWNMAAGDRPRYELRNLSDVIKRVITTSVQAPYVLWWSSGVQRLGVYVFWIIERAGLVLFKMRRVKYIWNLFQTNTKPLFHAIC